MIQAMLRVLALLAAGTTGTAAEPQSPPQVREGARPAGDVPADEIVVVTASRREEQLRNAPATMSVVTGEKITHAIPNTVHLPGGGTGRRCHHGSDRRESTICADRGLRNQPL